VSLQAVVDGEIARDDAQHITRVIIVPCYPLVASHSKPSLTLIIALLSQMQLQFTNGEIQQKIMATSELKQAQKTS